MHLDTTMDRYLTLADRAPADPAALEELIGLFAPDASVRLADETATGREAIAAMYRRMVATVADGKHFWKTEILPDGQIRVEWASAHIGVDGTLSAQSGIEHATLDAEGRILRLRNEFTRQPG